MKPRGFTMLELMISILVIAMTSTVMFVTAVNLQKRTDLQSAKQTVLHVMRSAVSRSKGMIDDSGWGIYAENGQITLWRGTDYLNRNQGEDEVYELPISITVSGNQEIRFHPLTGSPVAPSTLTLSSEFSETITFTPNNKGIIEVQ